MTKARKPEPTWLLVRLIGGSLLAAAGLGSLAWWWYQSVPLEMQAAQLGIAGAVVGAWAGCIPPALSLGAGPERQASGALAGLGVRFFVTALLALLLSETIPERAARMVMLGWLGVAQLVFLSVDVAHQIVLVRQATSGDG